MTQCARTHNQNVFFTAALLIASIIPSLSVCGGKVYVWVSTVQVRSSVRVTVSRY